ncbi:hypothetical protein BH23CHL8_BH23CHL8_09920 [soil metagenome]
MGRLRRVVVSALPRRLHPGLRRARTWAWITADSLRVAGWRLRRIPASPASVPHASRAPENGHVLIIDASMPDATRDAGSVFMLDIMRLLRDEGHAVTFLADDGGAPAAGVFALARLGVRTVEEGTDAGRWILAHGRDLTHVIVARPDIAQRHLHRARRWSPARILYYTHDLHSLRERRRWEVTGSPAARDTSARVGDIEAAVLRSADAVLTPSSAEVPHILRLAPGQEVHVVVPILNVPDALHREAQADLSGRRAIMCLGSFTHEPNVDAASVLVAEVMPVVWARFPEAEVMVIGQDPPPAVQALTADPRVEVTGHVPDLEPYWARARLLAAPLRYGAGVKGKVISALAAGVPVVTTSIGNEGIDLVDGRHAFIADAPHELAERICDLLADGALSRRLADAGRRHIAGHFSEARARSELVRALGPAPGPSRRRSRAAGSRW